MLFFCSKALPSQAALAELLALREHSGEEGCAASAPRCCHVCRPRGHSWRLLLIFLPSEISQVCYFYIMHKVPAPFYFKYWKNRGKKRRLVFSETLRECLLGTSENTSQYLFKVSNKSLAKIFHFLSDTLHTEIDDMAWRFKDCCIIVSI